MKIGFVSMPLSGHLNPMTALARKLQSRGNEVVFIGIPDAEPSVRAANLNFVPFCENEYPAGSVAKNWGPVAKLHGLEVVQYSCRELLPGLCKAALEHLPEKLVKLGIEALVFDTIYFFLELVPMRFGIPYAHIWNVLNLDFSGSTPAMFFPWPHEATPEALTRNMEGMQLVGELITPVASVAQAYAKKVGLEIDWSNPTSTFSKLAVISQIPKEFDFPNIPWPTEFRYTGPFHDDEGREEIPFPWEKLNGKPLIYASMGTLVNGLDSVYNTILKAVGNLPEIQVVLAVGSNIELNDLGPIPPNAIVVRKAPQIALLKRAALCITHAGLNTTLESLAQGVPMVAIPVGYDQPGVAARIAYHGAGEFVEVGNLTVENLSELIQKVQKNSSYRDRARYFQKVIAQTHGLDSAADVLEQAFERDRTELLSIN